MELVFFREDDLKNLAMSYTNQDDEADGLQRLFTGYGMGGGFCEIVWNIMSSGFNNIVPIEFPTMEDPIGTWINIQQGNGNIVTGSFNLKLLNQEVSIDLNEIDGAIVGVINNLSTSLKLRIIEIMNNLCLELFYRFNLHSLSSNHTFCFVLNDRCLMLLVR